uniref:Uncharacterized protein n=1 Tax=Ananas comosus var. bracteatus TaxID=296719 RepID=A0A6V7NXK8_ANACO|nr:unnamed protein product [Ananas comosus var. bracteatus]
MGWCCGCCNGNGVGGAVADPGRRCGRGGDVREARVLLLLGTVAAGRLGAHPSPAGSPANTTVSTTASAITPVDWRDHDDHVAATAGGPTTRHWWWDRGVRALRKVREWSEVIAGPRWKTFLRRLGRRRRGGAGAGAGGRFGYDPLSYARNFDERNGSGGGGGADDSDDDAFRRGFSVRYAALPVSTKSSMDLGDLSDGGGEIVPWTRFTA